MIQYLKSYEIFGEGHHRHSKTLDWIEVLDSVSPTPLQPSIFPIVPGLIILCQEPLHHDDPCYFSWFGDTCGGIAATFH
jgi:hypothetical protein